MLSRLRSFWKAILGRRRIESEMREEIEFHIEQRAADLMRSGVPAEDAGRMARVEFGSRPGFEEKCREARGLRFLDELLQDLRYALRSLRSKPGFAAVAVASLALGIGANTAIFSVLNSLVLKPLPVSEPEQLFVLRKRSPRPVSQRFSYPFFQRLQGAGGPREMAAMSRVARFYSRIGGEQRAEWAYGQLVSGEYFGLFGSQAVLGRLLSAEDNRIPGGHPVAVLSYGYWQRRFGGSADVLGRAITLNSCQFTVVGVAGPGFRGVWVESPVDLWIPLMMQHDVRYSQHFSNWNGDMYKPWVPQEDISWLDVVVRTRPSEAAGFETASSGAYQRSLESFAARLGSPEERKLLLSQKIGLEPFVRGFSNLRTRFSAPLSVLMAMVAVVLLIACANLANLLLSRSAAREREIAIRLSIGAGRGRLVRQLMTESLLLALLGGAAGLLMSQWAQTLLLRMATGKSGPTLETDLDIRVLGFTAAISILTAILFGLAPALRATRLDVGSALKSRVSGAHGAVRGRMARLLVVVQVTLSLLLLVGAGLFARSLRNLIRVNPGFDRENVLLASIDPLSAGFPSGRMPELYRKLTTRLEQIPGVKSAAVAMCGLFSGCRAFAGIEILGYQKRPGDEILVQENRVTPGYFRTVGIRLIAGRDFDSRDRPDSPRVAVVNETMARRFWPSGNAIGQRFGYDKPDMEIIGVVSDARVNDVREAVSPMAYYPLFQAVVHAGAVHVRASADAQSLAPAIRTAIAEIEPELPLEGVTTIDEQVRGNLLQEHLVARLTGAFAALAVALACVGLYGVMAHGVARRTGEIGVRMALGASRPSILWMVLAETLIVLAAGVAVGIPVALACARLVAELLFGLPGHDVATLGAAAAILFAVGTMAGSIPALRASRVDPAVALRTE
jgi:predicted permease